MKLMKKISAIVLSLCLCIPCFSLVAHAADGKISFTDPETIALYYMEQLRHQEQEQLVCMFLNTRNQFLGEAVLSKGTVNASLISPREIFLTALQYHAVQLILVHNHPSGDASASKEDILLTRRVAQAGELLGITLLDHIVIGDHEYVSLRRQGVLAE